MFFRNFIFISPKLRFWIIFLNLIKIYNIWTHSAILKKKSEKSSLFQKKLESKADLIRPVTKSFRVLKKSCQHVSIQNRLLKLCYNSEANIYFNTVPGNEILHNSLVLRGVQSEGDYGG